MTLLDPWFDMSAFLSLAAEKGDNLQLCIKSIARESVVKYGLNEKPKMKCRILTHAYVIQEEFSQIPIAVGQQPLQFGKYIACIFPEGFSPSEVNSDSLMVYRGRPYQSELIEPVSHLDQILLYKYRLIPTNSAADLFGYDNSIVEIST